MSEMANTHPALDVVVMAAGKGTRMKSRLPKGLQKLAGRPLMAHVLDAARPLKPRTVVIVTGHGADAVEAAARATQGDEALCFARQEQQLGTGHAVQQALPHLRDDAVVLVLSADVPLTHTDTLRQLLALTRGDRLALLTLALPQPTGYGRVLRAGGDGAVLRIVEEKDATEAERQVQEIYTGIMAAPVVALRRWLARLDANNAQGEYYLTDVVRFAVEEGTPVVACQIDDPVQAAGVNSPAQLAELERLYQRRQADAQMAAGVRLADPSRIDIRGTLVCGTDVFIDINCVFEGEVRLGDGVQIGPNCVIANAQIGDDTQVEAYSHIQGEAQGVSVGAHNRIGPFARLRPGARLADEVHIGNFVEVKNSVLGHGSKANHLAYLGDATVGQGVNYGAGSITANYDGANKHRTVIEDQVHVGSNCVLVAPVTLGQGGTVGGGSTITKSTAPGALTVSRARQVSIPNWSRPTKQPR